jgi:hypothetical protein
MDASVLLWENWQQQVKQLCEGVHGHQKKTLALIVIGIILAGSAVLQRMAESVQLAGISEAKMPSIERRFARFVANERIVVSEVWKHFLSQGVPYWHGKAVRLVLDCTPCGEKATIVYLGLLVHSRVLPLMWRVMPLQEQWEEQQWQLVGQMFDQVKPYLESCECTLIADRGLSGIPLVKLCRARGWQYLLRICKEHTVRRQMSKRFAAWTACGSIVQKAGQQWVGHVLCWQEETIDTYLSAVWDAEHREAWFLISDLPAGRRRVQE